MTKQVVDWFREAAKEAKLSTCLRRKCGSVIVKDGLVIGRGYNSPPGDDKAQRRCLEKIDKTAKYPTDKTCCVHAEQRAMFDALTNHSELLFGADLYFVEVDDGGHMQKAGDPYCTICSKMALDLGLVRFGLWQESGANLYDTRDYNRLSYKS